MLEYLKKTGLTEGEIKVYSAILELGVSSLNNIHERTAIERRNIYDILNKLIEKGLVSYTIEKGKKTFQLTHPKRILSYLEERKEKISQTEKEIAPQIENLSKEFLKTKSEIRAEVYRGNESIKTLLTEILEHKESFWLGGNGFENYTAVPEHFIVYFEHWMRKRVKKKHVMHDLVSHGTFLNGLEPKNIKIHKKNFYKYCPLPRDVYVPMVAVIFGDKVAQVIWGQQSFAFVIESKKVEDSFMRYFNHFWKNPW